MGVGETAGIIKYLEADGAVTGGLIAKFSDSDDKVKLAAANTDSMIGVFTASGKSGERVPVMLSGIATVKAGGNVTRGASVATDAKGKGVAAANGKRYVGIAMKSGVNGDLIPMLICPGFDSQKA